MKKINKIVTNIDEANQLLDKGWTIKKTHQEKHGNKDQGYYFDYIFVLEKTIIGKDK